MEVRNRDRSRPSVDEGQPDSGRGTEDRGAEEVSGRQWLKIGHQVPVYQHIFGDGELLGVVDLEHLDAAAGGLLVLREAEHQRRKATQYQSVGSQIGILPGLSGK
jgi:hypothetical protein